MGHSTSNDTLSRFDSDVFSNFVESQECKIKTNYLQKCDSGKVKPI